MLTIPLVKATSSAYWLDFGLRSTATEHFYHPSGCRFTQHVQVRLGVDQDDCVAAFDMRLAPCLVDHPVLAAWGCQLMAATLKELRDPAFQPWAEELAKSSGEPWLREPHLKVDGFDSELIVERQGDGWVRLNVCLTEYVGCECGRFNPVTARKCSRCKTSVGKKPVSNGSSSGGGGKWWPFGKKS